MLQNKHKYSNHRQTYKGPKSCYPEFLLRPLDFRRVCIGTWDRAQGGVSWRQRIEGRNHYVRDKKEKVCQEIKIYSWMRTLKTWNNLSIFLQVLLLLWISTSLNTYEDKNDAILNTHREPSDTGLCSLLKQIDLVTLTFQSICCFTCMFSLPLLNSEIKQTEAKNLSMKLSHDCLCETGFMQNRSL